MDADDAAAPPPPAEEAFETHHSFWTMVSFGFGTFIDEFLNVAFGMFVFYFYEAELGLATWLTTLGYIIYSVWNAINDPYTGYWTNRPYRFVRKLGRRFPWIMAGGLGWIAFYVLLYTPPTTDVKAGAWLVFAWLVLSTCLYDTFSTIWGVNFFGLFPDKFRGKERRKAASIDSIVGFLGIAVGSLVPPMFVTYGDPKSYVTQGLLLFAIGLVALLLSAKGSRDDPENVERWLAQIEKQPKAEPFLKVFRRTLRQKNFVVLLLIFFLSQLLTGLLLASINYLVRYILGEQSGGTTTIMAGFLVGALFTVPLWTRMANKLEDNRKSMILIGLVQAVFTLPLLFVSSKPLVIAGALLFGISYGGNVVLKKLILADTIDESVAITEKREEGVYMGVRAFFGRFGFVAQALVMGLIHELTGFVEGQDVQSDLAKLGIRIHLALVPALAALLQVLLLVKWYDLTPAKMKRIHKRIAELRL